MVQILGGRLVAVLVSRRGRPVPFHQIQRVDDDTRLKSDCRRCAGLTMADRKKFVDDRGSLTAHHHPGSRWTGMARAAFSCWRGRQMVGRRAAC